MVLSVGAWRRRWRTYRALGHQRQARQHRSNRSQRAERQPDRAVWLPRVQQHLHPVGSRGAASGLTHVDLGRGGTLCFVWPRLILDILSSGDSHHYRRGQRTPRRTGPNQATGSILPNGGLLTGRGVRSADQVPKYSWIWRMAIDPSPTADATRLTEPLRTSPAANTPGRLVSSIIG
jgi:hypothetical protein